VDAPAPSSLVSRLKGGDPHAFDDIYRQLHPRLYSFLWRLTRRPEVAVELCQETWLRLAAEAAWLNDDTHLAAWLFTVARNLFLSHRRWSLLDGSRLAEVSLWSGGRREETTPETTAMASEAQRGVEAALAALPVKYREALLLVSVEHFEPSQAAGIIGISPEAFRQRLSRAREQLRVALASGETK
jgi:RNA polymerase sigma-70 factor (ECF subfamily)